MKKILLVLTLGISLTFVGCSSADNIEVSETKVGAQTQEAHINLNGQNLEIGMNITEDIINKLGEPLDIQNAPSCHYDGNDTIYAYEGFTLYAYQDGEENNLYIIELLNENVQTPQGSKVGMTKDEVIALHGEDYTFEGTILSYEKDDMSIEFTIDESDIVTLIEIVEI